MALVSINTKKMLGRELNLSDHTEEVIFSTAALFGILYEHEDIDECKDVVELKFAAQGCGIMMMLLKPLMDNNDNTTIYLDFERLSNIFHQRLAELEL